MTTRAPVRPVRPATPVRHRHRRWPYLLALFLVLVLAGGAAYVFYRTPVFGLQQITVTSSSGQVSEDVDAAVRSAVDAPTGTPLIGLDLAAIRTAALTVPQLRSASVSRHWPNGLLIQVDERSPVALTRANGSLWLIDSTGVPYVAVQNGGTPPAGLLTLALATPGPKDQATLAGLAVIGALDRRTKGTVGSVSVKSAYSVTLHLIDGRVVIWGSPDLSRRKLQVLPAVLAQPGHTYDVSDPEYVTVR